MKVIKPWRVTIDTNPDLCNYRCIMCDTHSRYNKNYKSDRANMAPELLRKVIGELKELGVKEIIPSTMGEPLLYEHFDIFIEELIFSDIKLNLTTNGSFPRKGAERWAELLLPILSDIKISLNSLDYEVNEAIMENSRTEATIENILYFVKERDRVRAQGINFPTITVQVTFMKQNLKELQGLIEFAIEHKIDRVKGHHLWVNWEELKDESLENDRAGRVLWNNFVQKIEKYKSLIKLDNFSTLMVTGDNSGINSELNCPFLGKELWIDSVGNYNVCCAPSSRRELLGEFGSIEDRTVLELFNSAQYGELLSSYKNHAVCNECPLRR